jgi:predicted nucleic acid-binding Zn ribbon protein
MTPTEKAIAQIEAHERECAVRYEAIEKRLQSGEKRFDRLEMMIWGVYVTVVVAVALPQFM